jgi:hypothetical protein
METSAQSSSSHLTESSGRPVGLRHSEDLLYQAVTIAAILMLLGSVWVF